MKKYLLVFTLLVCFAGFAFSLTLPEDYIKDGIGVRPLGMGGAFTAVSGNIDAAFYNPAGLDSISPFNYAYGSLDNSKVRSNADSYTLFNMGSLCFTNIMRTSVSNEAVNISSYSFGYRGTYGFSYGLTYKNVAWNVIGSSGIGYSADLGVMSRITPDLSLGLLWQDFASSKELGIPTTSRAGLSYNMFDDNVLLAFDLESGRSEPGNHTYYGAEWRTADSFTLRAGADRGRPTFGFSISSPMLLISYAALYDDSVTGGTVHMFSMGTDLAPKKKRPFSVIRPKEFALIEIGGPLIGGVGEISIFGGGKLGADNVIAYIKDVTKDPYVDGIILKIKGFEGGIGSLGIVQGIREELKKAKAKDKLIIAYIESSALGEEYYLASVADYIVAPPNATVGGIGKSISIVRIKGLLEKLGVETQMLSVGKYKTTFNMFGEGLTKSQKKMMRVLVSDLYRQMVDDIKADRKELKKGELKKIADGRIISAKNAKKIGLIDELGYFKDAAKGGAEKLGDDKEPLVVDRSQIFVKDDKDFLFSFPNKMAVIEINGDIVTGKSGQNIIFGGKATGADTIVDQIKKATDDWQIKAIIVRVNSGGGSAIASKQIYAELKKAREKGKIVVASFGDVAASGGYYVGCAADHIVANPGTITGSIGVIGARLLVIKELFKKIGLKVETVKEGKHSDMFSGLRKLSSIEIESLTEVMEETYDDFVAAVAGSRGLTTAEVRDVAQGKIYTGSQAKDLKLVDTLGNFSDAVDEAADLSGIGGEPELIYYRENDFWAGFGINTIKVLGLDQGLFPNMQNELTEYRLY
ncbi:signal peptide peptidase SppA [Candidatus Margulisiibacteriota bacterium]